MSADLDLDWTILMARAQNGDAAAYLRLLEEITPYLRSMVRRGLYDRNDTEDTVQDILLTVHEIRLTYDPARPFGPWLVAIARRRIVDRLRRQGRIRVREAPMTAEHDNVSDPRPARIDTLGEGSLEGAIDSLPPLQQKAIRLLKLKELSLKEASTASGMSIASLKGATHRAVQTLRSLLADRGDK